MDRGYGGWTRGRAITRLRIELTGRCRITKDERVCLLR